MKSIDNISISSLNGKQFQGISRETFTNWFGPLKGASGRGGFTLDGGLRGGGPSPASVRWVDLEVFHFGVGGSGGVDDAVFVGFWPHVRLSVARRARCCGGMGVRCLVGFLFGLLGIFRAVGGGRMGFAWLWVSLLWRLRRE